jgi:hypothetical protein
MPRKNVQQITYAETDGTYRHEKERQYEKVLQAVHMTPSVQNAVSATTVCNCFNKAGFNHVAE